ERATNVGSTVRADFSFGPIRPYVSAGGGNAKERINREIDQRARHRDRSYGAGARIQIFEGLFATVGGRQLTTTFDEDEEFRGENLAAALNHRLEAIDTTVGVALTPLTSLWVLVSNERDTFDVDHERDSETLRVMPPV